MLNTKLNLRQYDFSIFLMLVLLVILYQLQFLWIGIKKYHIREIIYAYLYLRLLVLAKSRYDKELLFKMSYLILATIIGLYTWYLYSAELAILGFLRFVNVALLAPLAYVFTETRLHLKKLIFIWSFAIILGIVTVIYQLYIGEMTWLVRDYVAIRGDLVRHKSLLGEPNVGGFASAILFFIALIVVKNLYVRFIAIFLSLFLVIVSLSKAAVGIFVIGNILVAAVALILNKKNNKLLSSYMSGVLILIFSGVILSTNPSFREYAAISWKSITGELRGEPTPYRDLNDRFLEGRYGLGSTGQKYKTLILYSLGGSFGLAGSVAVELNVPNAVAPHNGYLEIFLVGGSVALIIFLFNQFRTLYMLYLTRQTDDEIYECLFLVFILLGLNLVGYPTMYEPVNGSLFWLIIGITGKKLTDLKKEI